MSGVVSLEHFEVPGSPFRIPDFAVQETEREPDPSDRGRAADLPNRNDGPQDPVPEADIETERLKTLTRIEQALVSIDAKFEASQKQVFQRLGDRFARSVAGLLPHLIETSGTTEIAASVVAIVEKSRQEKPVVDVSPHEYDQIVEHLEKLNSPLQVQVRRSVSAAPGTASLHWDGGGAEIDLNAVLEKARQQLAGADIPSLTGAKEP